MIDKNQENIFNGCVNNFININGLKIKINQQLAIIKEEFKNKNEIKENASKILFNLKDNNFEIKENLRLLDYIYSQIENIYKTPINNIENKNKNLIFTNKYIKVKLIEEKNEIISKNNQNITLLNYKKISKWKNNLIIIFTLGFYNKNKKLNKKIQKYKEENKRWEKYLLKLNCKKNDNESVINTNMKTLQRKEQEFNLVKQVLDNCVFCFTEIQKIQAQSNWKPIDIIETINSFPEQILTNNYKPNSPKM